MVALVPLTTSGPADVPPGPLPSELEPDADGVAFAVALAAAAVVPDADSSPEAPEETLVPPAPLFLDRAPSPPETFDPDANDDAIRAAAPHPDGASRQEFAPAMAEAPAGQALTGPRASGDIDASHSARPTFESKGRPISEAEASSRGPTGEEAAFVRPADDSAGRAPNVDARSDDAWQPGERAGAPPGVADGAENAGRVAGTTVDSRSESRNASVTGPGVPARPLATAGAPPHARTNADAEERATREPGPEPAPAEAVAHGSSARPGTLRVRAATVMSDSAALDRAAGAGANLPVDATAVSRDGAAPDSPVHAPAHRRAETVIVSSDTAQGGTARAATDPRGHLATVADVRVAPPRPALQDAFSGDDVQRGPGHDLATPLPAAVPPVRVPGALAPMTVLPGDAAGLPLLVPGPSVVSSYAMMHPYERAENIGRLVQSMRVLVRDGASEATIRLRPEHLGDVNISLRVDGRSVSAVVRAEAAGVREWLQLQHESLRQSLALHGLSLDRLDVEPDERRERREHDEEQPRRPRPRPLDPGARFDVIV
jgi:hypothetical protein